MDPDLKFPDTYKEYAMRVSELVRSPCRAEFRCPNADKDKNLCYENCRPLAYYRATMPDAGWMNLTRAVDFEGNYDIELDPRKYFNPAYEKEDFVASGSFL